MSAIRGPGSAKVGLDDLLSRLPSVGAEPSGSDWAARLERTMQRVQDARLDANSARELETELDDVLRTPLPVEAGEPEPLDPYGFEAAEGALYDELRAPLQSGEHAPLRLPANATDHSAAAIAAVRSAPMPLGQRSTLHWLVGAIGTLAAAAAAVLYVQRAQEAPLATSLGLEPNAPAQTSPIVKAQSAEMPGAEMPGAEIAHRDVTATQPTKSAEKSEDKSPDESETLAVAVHRSAPAAAQHGAPPVAALPQMKASAASKSNAPAPAESEPALTPAAGPSHLDDHPTSGAVMSALARVAPEAQRCLSPSLPQAPIHVVFRASGQVQRVDVTGANIDARTRNCLTSAYAKAQVQPFARAQYEVNTTISLPNGP